MFKNCLTFCALISCFGLPAWAQEPLAVRDSIVGSRADTSFLQPAKAVADSAQNESAKIHKKSSLDNIIYATAQDSMRIDFKQLKVYMFKENVLTYGDYEIKSGKVDLNLKTKGLHAGGLADSAGRMLETPSFKDGDDTFDSEAMSFNFETKKGVIDGVRTEESGGYLYAEKSKRISDSAFFIRGGSFTTCDLKHPHFAFRFRKSKVVPGDKIYTGPAYFELAGIPTPLLVPFGLFPNQSGRRSGLIIPTYGQSNKQGYYFMDGGYYWAANDYMDFTFLGSIYTRGSWALGVSSNYKVRYRFNGRFDIKYAINILGNEGSPDYQRSKDFKVYWTHQQDSKARPKSKFSANVNVRSSSFNQYELRNSYNDRLSSSFQSSVNYATRFGKGWNMNINLGHSQNTQTKVMELKLPELSLSGSKLYPFRRKIRQGKLRWYENISLRYSMVAKNQISLPDSLFFTPGWEKHFRNGMKHTVPISSQLKVFKVFNWTNTVSLNSTWYANTYRKHWQPEQIIGGDTIAQHVAIDTVSGFRSANTFNFTSSLTTKLYGMFRFGQNFPIRAIRHVLTPSISFAYRPDFSEEGWGYYDSYYNPVQEQEVVYSHFDGTIYGGPGRGKQGSLRFSLSNNFEMKVRDRKDTISGTRKVVLIESLTLSSSYNMAKDSLRWSPLMISARTKLLKNLDLRYASAWDPYVLDSTGSRNLNQYEWDVNHRLFRMKNMSWTVGMQLNLSEAIFNKKSGDKKDKKAVAKLLPWSLSVNYSLRYGMQHLYKYYVLEKKKDVVQTLGFNAKLQLTPNWRITMRSGYDFELKKLSYTQVEVYRDLHCWEMRFSWIPTGAWKSWNFGINLKASMFKDLKVEKKKRHLDY